jgi:flagellar basal-body rod modification protein FlgD
MAISGVSDVGNVSSNIQTVNGKTFGKDEFMNILIQQLKNQDPLNPMDSTQFTSQLTQFSTLEQLTNMNSTLDNVLAFQHSMQNASIANLIGRTVTVSGDTTNLNNTADLSYELSNNAASVNISIYDGAGKLVATRDAGPQLKGDNKFIWDGKDTSGNQMPKGAYTFEVKAQDIYGNTVEALTNSTGAVTGVVFKDDMTYLVLNDGRNIGLSEIEAIQ